MAIQRVIARWGLHTHAERNVMKTITPTITARQVEELDTLLKGRLRTAVAGALSNQSDLIGSAEDISKLVGGIDALQRAKDHGYLIDPADTADEKIENIKAKVKWPGQ